MELELTKKITTCGGNASVLIPKAVMKKMGWHVGMEIEIKDGGKDALIIKKA